MISLNLECGKSWPCKGEGKFEEVKEERSEYEGVVRGLCDDTSHNRSKENNRHLL